MSGVPSMYFVMMSCTGSSLNSSTMRFKMNASIFFWESTFFAAWS